MIAARETVSGRSKGQRGENLARDEWKTRLPRFAQAGGRDGDVRQSRHHGTAADGRLRGRARHQIHPRTAGSRPDGDGRRLCASLRRARGAQPSCRARARQCHGHALRRHEGEFAGAGHRRPAGYGVSCHRAGPHRGPADIGAAVRQMGGGSASRRRLAALCASRGKNRAGAADRPGVFVSARRHFEERRRHRFAGADAGGAARARRCRSHCGGRRTARQGRAAGHHRRRCGGAEPRPQGARCARRSRRCAGLCRVHPEQRLVSGVASALSRHDDPLAGRRARRARQARSGIFRRRRFVHLVAAIACRSVAAGAAAHPSRHRSVADRQELSGAGRDPRRSQGDAARHHGGRRCAHDRERQELPRRRGCNRSARQSRRTATHSAPRPARSPARRRCSRWRFSKPSVRCCRRTRW